VEESKKEDTTNAETVPEGKAKLTKAEHVGIVGEIIRSRGTLSGDILERLNAPEEEELEPKLVATQQATLAAMNDRHAVIGSVGGKCRVIEWMPSEVDPGAMVPVFQSKADFINRYANRPGGWRNGELLSLGEWWFRHPHREDYRGVVFKPGALAIISERIGAGNFLNLWRGYGMEPKKGKWPLMRDHIEQIVSANDAKMAKRSMQISRTALSCSLRAKAYRT
jgi:hypothetical protein